MFKEAKLAQINEKMIKIPLIRFAAAWMRI